MNNAEKSPDSNTNSTVTHSKPNGSHLRILTILVVLMALVFMLINSGMQRGKLGTIIQHDAAEYYQYLPAIFIYHDLEFGFLKNDFEKFKNKIIFLPGPKRKPVIKMGMGLAVMNSPFFLGGHLWALVTGAPADGYSAPYETAIWLAAVFYMALGIWFLGRFLLRYVCLATTLLIVLLTVLATNLFNYTTNQPGMSHAASFAMIAVFVWLTDQWNRQLSWKNSVWLSVIFGLIVLIRPTNAIVVLLPVLWKVQSMSSLREKLDKIISNYPKILLMIIISFLLFLPQMLYWKHVTGSFLFSPYSLKNEGLFLTNPQILNQLFSFRNGWLVYTPVMIFSLIGLITLFKKRKEMFWPIATFTVVNIYLLSSWWCWWFVGFGNRAYIDSYAIAAIPLAFVVESVMQKKIVFRYLTIGLGLLFILINQFQTRQYIHGIIHYNSMSREAYFAAFLNNPTNSQYWDLLVHPNNSEAIKGRYFQNDFTSLNQKKKPLTGANPNQSMPVKTGEEKFHDQSVIVGQLTFEAGEWSLYKKYATNTVAFKGTRSCLIESPQEFVECYNNRTDSLLNKGNISQFVKASIWYKAVDTLHSHPLSLVISEGDKQTGHYVATNQKYKAGIRNGWILLTCYLPLNELKNPSSRVKIFVWRRSNQPVYIDQFIVSVGEVKTQ